MLTLSTGLGYCYYFKLKSPIKKTSKMDTSNNDQLNFKKFCF